MISLICGLSKTKQWTNKTDSEKKLVAARGKVGREMDKIGEGD